MPPSLEIQEPRKKVGEQTLLLPPHPNRFFGWLIELLHFGCSLRRVAAITESRLPSVKNSLHFNAEVVLMVAPGFEKLS